MLFPMPMGYGDMPPTDTQMKLRPGFIFIFVLQLVGAILRFIYLDIWGGVMCLVLVAIGCYAVNRHMDVTWVACYGICCFMNGLVDLVQGVEIIVHNRSGRLGADGKLLDEDLTPPRRMFRNIVMISVPVIHLAAAIMSMLVFRAARSMYEQSPRDTDGYNPSAPLVQHNMSQSPIRSPGQFRAFEGPGRRLEGSDEGEKNSPLAAQG